jgi:predicted DNA-binding protein
MFMADMVRVSQKTDAILDALAKKTQRSKMEIVDKAIELYRRKLFMDEVNQAYDKLKSNPVNWQDELKERELFENTLLDDIEGETH